MRYHLNFWAAVEEGVNHPVGSGSLYAYAERRIY